MTLPTDENPVLTIRDYGPGLSHSDVFNVFAKYGASTKRGSNETIGMLGIGSKSGFAYSDTFTVTTWNGGWRGTYAAVLDPSERGKIDLLDESFEAGDETGVQIQIPVRLKDVREFHTKAQSLYAWFEPRPEINTQLPEPPPGRRLENGRINNSNTNSWIAVMGCIPYRVNVEQLAEEPGFDLDLFQKISGALFFKIGEVSVSGSREELRYTDETKRALASRFTALVDEYVQTVLEEIKDSTLSPWEKRLRAQVLHTVGIPVPKGTEKEIFSRTVAIPNPPKTFSIQRGSAVTSTVGVHAEVRLLIQDDRRSLKGFGLDEHAYVVKPLARQKLEDIRAELDKVLEQYGLTGVPIANLSSLPWTQPWRGGRDGKKNVKHRVSSFRLIPEGHFYRPYSNAWEPEAEREASEDDVYVILENFQVVGARYDFYSSYRRAVKVAKTFGIAVPEVYGYKTTAKKPVATAPGKHFNEWYQEFLGKLDRNLAKDLVEAQEWSEACRYNYEIDDKMVAKVTEKLGAGSMVARFAIKVVEAKKTIEQAGFNEDLINFLRTEVLKKTRREAPEASKKAILATYPLLTTRYGDMGELWGNDSDKWLDYVKLVDDTNNAKKEA